MIFRTRKQQAISLGVTLLIVLLLATLGLALARVSVTHLHLNLRSSREIEASNLARSAVARAIQEIFDDRTYGSTRAPGSEISVDLSGDREAAVGRLAFEDTRARAWGIAYSTNNLEGSAAVQGDGRTVPAHAIHLVGVGESGGVVRRVETLLRFTLFPQAIASSGPVGSTGPLLVATLANPDLVTEDGLLPADLMSNADGASSVNLSADSRITGDVQSVGEIVLDDTVEVWGEVRDEATPEDIPTLDPADFDPAALGISHETLGDPTLNGADEVFEGAVRASGDLTITGNARLDGSLLYVPGNLVVHGSLSGKGIVCADGDIEVRSGADFVSGQRMAVISTGQVRLTGRGQASSFLQGVVYCRKGIIANQITVIGALVNDGAASDAISLDRTRVFYDPDFEGVTLTPVAGLEVLTKLQITDYSFVVAVNAAAEPPQLEYFRYDGDLPGTDHQGLAQAISGQSPVATFEIPQDLLDDTDGAPPGGGSGAPSGPFMGPGGSVAPGRGNVGDVFDALSGLDAFHHGLVEDDLPELLTWPIYSNYTLAELAVHFPQVMSGGVARGFLWRDTTNNDQNTDGDTTVTLTPSEFLRPNEHNRVVFWSES